jgi:hypothetical protein
LQIVAQSRREYGGFYGGAGQTSHDHPSTPPTTATTVNFTVIAAT